MECVCIINEGRRRRRFIMQMETRPILLNFKLNDTPPIFFNRLVDELDT